MAGALTDFGLSVTRYWNNIIGDFFTQAAIDFLLGNVSAQVFAEFETNMMSGDPAISMKKVRQNASKFMCRMHICYVDWADLEQVETSVKIVVEDGKEELVAGWVLLAPAEDNTMFVFSTFLCLSMTSDVKTKQNSTLPRDRSFTHGFRCIFLSIWLYHGESTIVRKDSSWQDWENTIW